MGIGEKCRPWASAREPYIAFSIKIDNANLMPIP